MPAVIQAMGEEAVACGPPFAHEATLLLATAVNPPARSRCHGRTLRRRGTRGRLPLPAQQRDRHRWSNTTNLAGLLPFLIRSRIVFFCNVAGDTGLPYDHIGTVLLHDATYAAEGDLVARNADKGGAA